MADAPQSRAFRTLSPADGDALDAILEARARGLDRGPLPPGSADRAERIERLLGLLDRYPADEPAEDLTQRTMDRVRQARQRERFAQQVQMLTGPRSGLGVGWRQIAAAAAVFIIGFSLLLPVMQRTRTESQRLMGASNLAAASVGLGQYAMDNNDALPRRRVAPGAVWWNVGQPITGDDQVVNSNSAHLYLLVRQGYVEPETLSHPANALAPLPGQMTRQYHDWLSSEQVSFSYQNQYRPEPFKLSANPQLVILADRNPIFMVSIGRVVQDPNTPLDSPSRIYDGRGQNMLTGDGSVTFTLRPLVPRGEAAGDLIWGARGVERYSGTERPADENDSFLVP